MQISCYVELWNSFEIPTFILNVQQIAQFGHTFFVAFESTRENNAFVLTIGDREVDFIRECFFQFMLFVNRKDIDIVNARDGHELFFIFWNEIVEAFFDLDSAHSPVTDVVNVFEVFTSQVAVITHADYGIFHARAVLGVIDEEA